MAGRGRAATLPAWMTGGSSGAAAQPASVSRPSREEPEPARPSPAVGRGTPAPTPHSFQPSAHSYQGSGVVPGGLSSANGYPMRQTAPMAPAPVMPAVQAQAADWMQLEAEGKRYYYNKVSEAAMLVVVHAKQLHFLVLLRLLALGSDDRRNHVSEA